MKIILANKYLYPRGGDCIYTLRLMDLLTRNGHQVYPFSMHHPQNITTKYSRYFVPYINFRDELKNYSVKNAINVLSRAIVNKQAARLLDELIRDVKPDIVHLNNIHHQLTPEIIKAPAKYGIPIVWTLHDYILNCPDHEFLRDGKTCNKCASGNNIHAVIHRCKKGSLGASVIAAIESTYYNPRQLAQHVKKFISPSRFLADVLTDNGIPKSRVTSIPNFLASPDIKSTGDDYILYFGRLSNVKGVDTLIKSFAKAGKGTLVIVGDGPDRAELEKLAEMIAPGKVEFVGFQPQEKVFEYLAGCLVSVVPSIWWEVFGLTVTEAMAAGKPVIASRTGGIPEIIDHGETGLLFTPGNVDELTACIMKLNDNKSLAASMGKAGREKALTEYSAETHYKRIMKVYREVLDKEEYTRGESRVSDSKELMAKI